MPKSIRSFNADEEVVEIINEAELPKTQFSKWVNQQIKTAYKLSKEKPQIIIPRSKGSLIGVKL